VSKSNTKNHRNINSLSNIHFNSKFSACVLTNIHGKAEFTAFTVIVCEPLCFLINRFGLNAVEVVKNVVIDFYGVDVMVETAGQLLDNVYRLKLVDKLPHIPRHRNGEIRTIREVDGIISILTDLDEKKVLSSLPRYVRPSEDLENMPALRL
jgi:hypothetical protein